jgi:hypothetical protein
LLLHLLALCLHIRAEIRLTENLTAIDPNLHAGSSVDRKGGGLRVIDVSTDRVKRNATLKVLFGAAHLGTTEPTRHTDTDSLGTHAHTGRNGLLHGTTEGYAAL